MSGLSDGQLLALYSEKKDEAAFSELYERHSRAAYTVCLRALGDPAEAQDATVACFMLAVNKARSLSGRADLSCWMYWCARHVARRAALMKERRLQQERKAAQMEHEDSAIQSGRWSEILPYLESALDDLPANQREVLVMQYYRGLSVSRIAETLQSPQGTVASRIRYGLENLRKKLARVGQAVSADELSEGLGRFGVLATMPAEISARMKGMILLGAASTKAAAIVDSTLRMMFWSRVKAVAAVFVGAAVLAGGTLAASKSMEGASAKEPAQEKKVAEPGAKPAGKFATGVTDSGAQWTRESEPWAGCGISAYLDGPRKEMCCRNAPGTRWWYEPGGDFTIRRYNPSNERFYTIAGRARGQLDGPFSRARFGGIGYMHDHATAGSPDGRFVYFTEPDLGGLLRVMDFEKQTVSTMSKDLAFTGMTADSKGNLWGMKGRAASIVIVSPEGKVIEEKKLDLTGAGNAGPLMMSFQNMTLDEKRNRLYASNRATGDWTIWYWDLADGGKFVGVLMSNQNKENTPLRTLNETGLFKGTTQRCPGGIAFGMDDPEKRYLYQGGGDNTTFYRLDLEKQMIDTFGPVNPSEKIPYKTLGWVQAKWLPFGSVSQWCGAPTYDADGNIYMGVSLAGRTIKFTRVK
ncbi:MAG: hypothetical protein C0404_04415 [Verrucomicrobia bacterium]|nr:hypothetical protein [Verrucomicrobiota bacterium]